MEWKNQQMPIHLNNQFRFSLKQESFTLKKTSEFDYSTFKIERTCSSQKKRSKLFFSMSKDS